MWVGIRGIISKRAGKTDKGIATLRANNGKIVSSSRGKREVLEEHHRKLGTPKLTTGSIWNSRNISTSGLMQK